MTNIPIDTVALEIFRMHKCAGAYQTISVGAAVRADMEALAKNIAAMCRFDADTARRFVGLATTGVTS